MNFKNLITILSICSLISCATNNTTEKNVWENDAPELAYPAPNPDAPKETIEWGQFVGDWDCISHDLSDTIWYENKATWKWEYVLNGHAVQDFWYQEDNDPEAMQKDYYGSNLRIFNPKTKLWEIIWVQNKTHTISAKVNAIYEEGEMIMSDESGAWKVTFFNIQKNSFDWKSEIRNSDGTWKANSKIKATRKM